MSIEAVVFDCDGVILDSVPVKTRAFARLAEPYGEEARDRFVMYHARHGGVSRYKKFMWFFEEILGRQITEEESARWGENFKKYALEEVRACPMIPGALEVLETWHDKLPLFICSGAPEEEVRMILKERDLARFFVGIYGSPPGKSELLARIVKPFDPVDVVMVGDASTDREAAEHNDTQFYGVGPDLKGGNFPWSENLVPFNDWLKTRQ